MSDFCDCPVCGRVCCDHTVAERGGPFDKKQPRIPNIANLLFDQDYKCWLCKNYITKLPEVVPGPIVENQIKLVCSTCFHQKVSENTA